MQPWSKSEQPTAMDGLFQDERHHPRLSDFPWVCFMTEGTPYLVDTSYLKSSIWKSRCLGKNGSVCSYSFYKSLFKLTWKTKGVPLQCTKQSYHKTVRKNPCVFLSYKISQLLPNFPSRAILICFLSLQPTFLENFNMKKPRVFCCFYVIFIAVTILVQFYISFGGMQSVHRISCASIIRRQIRLAASPF